MVTAGPVKFPNMYTLTRPPTHPALLTSRSGQWYWTSALMASLTEVRGQVTVDPVTPNCIDSTTWAIPAAILTLRPAEWPCLPALGVGGWKWGRC